MCSICMALNTYKFTLMLMGFIQEQLVKDQRALSIIYSATLLCYDFTIPRTTDSITPPNELGTLSCFKVHISNWAHKSGTIAQMDMIRIEPGTNPQAW